MIGNISEAAFSLFDLKTRKPCMLREMLASCSWEKTRTASTVHILLGTTVATAMSILYAVVGAQPKNPS